MAYTSKGIVGHRKLGHTEDSILRSMVSGCKRKRTYNRKQAPKNPEIAERRRNKKKEVRDGSRNHQSNQV